MVHPKGLRKACPISLPRYEEAEPWLQLPITLQPWEEPGCRQSQQIRRQERAETETDQAVAALYLWTSYLHEIANSFFVQASLTWVVTYNQGYPKTLERQPDTARNCENKEVEGTAQVPLCPQKSSCGKKMEWCEGGNKGHSCHQQIRTGKPYVPKGMPGLCPPEIPELEVYGSELLRLLDF